MFWSCIPSNVWILYWTEFLNFYICFSSEILSFRHSNTACICRCYLSVSLFKRVTFPDISGVWDVFKTSVSIFYEWLIARLVIFPYSQWGIKNILRLASYLLNSGGTHDAEICHSGDICKIFRSRYCAKILSNLFGFRKYTHTNPIKLCVKIIVSIIQILVSVHWFIRQYKRMPIGLPFFLLGFQTKKAYRFTLVAHIWSANIVLRELDLRFYIEKKNAD